MKYYLRVIAAEAFKQHRNYFHSKSIYISLFIWPVLSFLTSYFGFLVFDFGDVRVDYLTADNLIIYLMLGYMCLSFFVSLVQSAWMFSMERSSGTLELVFLSPANRMAVILGNTISSLFESVVVMVVFACLVTFLHRNQLKVLLVPAILVILILNVLGILWGMFLNALFLYSRDCNFWFTILEDPMETFAGVKVPVSLFPTWAKVVAGIFPLTYVLEAVRSTFLAGSTVSQLSLFFLKSTLVASVLFFGALIMLKCVERHVRRTGNLTKF